MPTKQIISEPPPSGALSFMVWPSTSQPDLGTWCSGFKSPPATLSAQLRQTHGLPAPTHEVQDAAPRERCIYLMGKLPDAAIATLVKCMENRLRNARIPFDRQPLSAEEAQLLTVVQTEYTLEHDERILDCLHRNPSLLKALVTSAQKIRTVFDGLVQLNLQLPCYEDTSEPDYLHVEIQTSLSYDDSHKYCDQLSEWQIETNDPDLSELLFLTKSV